MQTYTFPAHYATSHRVQLIVIAPLTIIHLTLIISSSPSLIIAPVMLTYTCPAYFQSCFPSGAVNCSFLHHCHYKPLSRLLLMSQSDHCTNSADLHRPDHFSRHFLMVAFNTLHHHSFANLTTKSYLKSILIRRILGSLQRNPEECQTRNHHQRPVKRRHLSLTESRLSSLAKRHPPSLAERLFPSFLPSLATSLPLSLSESHLPSPATNPLLSLAESLLLCLASNHHPSLTRNNHPSLDRGLPLHLAYTHLSSLAKSKPKKKISAKLSQQPSSQPNQEPSFTLSQKPSAKSRKKLSSRGLHYNLVSNHHTRLVRTHPPSQARHHHTSKARLHLPSLVRHQCSSPISSHLPRLASSLSHSLATSHLSSLTTSHHPSIKSHLPSPTILNTHTSQCYDHQ